MCRCIYYNNPITVVRGKSYNCNLFMNIECVNSFIFIIYANAYTVDAFAREQ